MFIFFLLMTLCIFSQPSNAMGYFHEESLGTDSLNTTELVPNQSLVDTVTTIGKVGEMGGALGVPFVSYAGELAAGALGLSTLVLNMLNSRKKRALRTIVKAVEEKTDSGQVKAEILRRSPLDKTFDTIHAVVKEVTKE